VVPVAPPNQKERKEDQQTPPKTKKRQFLLEKNNLTKHFIMILKNRYDTSLTLFFACGKFFSSLSLFFYVLGFRKNTLNNKKDDVKFITTS